MTTKPWGRGPAGVTRILSARFKHVLGSCELPPHLRDTHDRGHLLLQQRPSLEQAMALANASRPPEPLQPIKLFWHCAGGEWFLIAPPHTPLRLLPGFTPL